MSDNLDPRRAAIVTEAKSWIGTPFHHEARIKGAGVDCLQLLVGVAQNVGIIGEIKIPHYSPDFHLHRDDETYYEGLLKYLTEIPGPPGPGDVALFKLTRIFWHGAIVVEWPRVIHADWNNGVVWGDVNLKPLRDHPVKFFSAFGDGSGGR
jgi:cell wall-associated NlpC family hydrolase